jgi:uncharacterized delta-60 repeat protein
VALVRLLSTGALDTTFGSGGKVSTAIGSLSEEANALAVQSDGKIVVTGYSNVKSGKKTYRRLLVARYTAAGALDSTFGSGGKVLIDLGAQEMGRSVAIQPDGKIVVAGYSFSSTTTNSKWSVLRFNANGSLDSTFGTNGLTQTSILNSAWATSVELDSSNRIVVGGTASDSAGDSYFVVARYLSNGALDSGF